MARSRRAQQQPEAQDVIAERELDGSDGAIETIEDGMASLFAELQASNALRSDDDEAGEVDDSATFVLLTELDRLWQRAA